MADISIIRGDDIRIVTTLTSDNLPFDLTGYTAQAQIRPSTVAGAPLTAEFDVTIDPDPQTGIITLELSHDITEGLNTNAVWDMQIVDDQGWVTTVVSGAVTIVPDVTRIEATGP